MLRRGGAENVDHNFHSPTDTNVSIVGSHVWVHVLQLPRAGQATHTPAYFRWTRTLAIVGKHVLQLCIHLLSPGGCGSSPSRVPCTLGSAPRFSVLENCFTPSFACQCPEQLPRIPSALICQQQLASATSSGQESERQHSRRANAAFLREGITQLMELLPAKQTGTTYKRSCEACSGLQS